MVICECKECLMNEFVTVPVPLSQKLRFLRFRFNSLKVTAPRVPFPLAQHWCKCILSLRKLHMLKLCSQDGTFETCPEPFHNGQIVFIHAKLKGGRAMPAVFAILSRKVHCLWLFIYLVIVNMMYLLRICNVLFFIPISVLGTFPSSLIKTLACWSLHY
jgi:hypothetical protein